MGMISRNEGRRAFGEDPQGYDSARPGYPARLYEILAERCCAGPGTRAYEIGPGPGGFTERLLGLGITSLVAIEPDARLAQFLRERLLGKGPAAVRVEQAAFEEVNLPSGVFDLGVAATSFHWLDPQHALAKAHDLLRPGGAWAMWWNVYSDPTGDDAFARATDTLFRFLPRTPSHRDGRRQAYGLDTVARTRDLAGAGFVAIVSEAIHWRMKMDANQIVALAATFSPVMLLPDEENARFLAELRDIVEQRFGGSVERAFVTPIYTARRPD